MNASLVITETQLIRSQPGRYTIVLTVLQKRVPRTAAFVSVCPLRSDKFSTHRTYLQSGWSSCPPPSS